ncbi:MAG: Flp family type IVb pilin [Bdellovibrionales bacterium]|nr:Flp family type IVb pilin [Bdellovibrionales bacterium]
MNKQTLFSLRKAKKEEGFTLLEYAAGAAVILTLVVVGLNAMGTSLSGFFTNVGTWATNSGDSFQDI